MPKTRNSITPSTNSSTRTLAVDIGGSGIKAMILDKNGKPVTERMRVRTPAQATPKAVISIIRELARKLGKFDRVSVGFPGVVKHGLIYSAPNLGPGWEGFELENALASKLKLPVRIANDADVQGLGVTTKNGVELVITLGTGFGSTLFADGRRIHIELGHHPFHKGKTYEEELGHRALKRKGVKKWNRMLREAIHDLKRTFDFDHLYIGGGDAKYISFGLPPDVTVIDNKEGMLGGIALWRDSSEPQSETDKSDHSEKNALVPPQNPGDVAIARMPKNGTKRARVEAGAS